MNQSEAKRFVCRVLAQSLRQEDALFTLAEDGSEIEGGDYERVDKAREELAKEFERRGKGLAPLAHEKDVKK